MRFDPTLHPHRRQNLLTGEWLVVSPHRSLRPWRGDESVPEPRAALAHDPDCYLCPGNLRATGERNPDYAGPYLFANDFAALGKEVPPPPSERLFPSIAANGEAWVLCFSPDHSRTLPELSAAELREVVGAWCDVSADLLARHDCVQVFENKGAMMGCSSPHPHGQVWASNFVPTQVAAEDLRQAEWLTRHGAVLLDEVAEAELAIGHRVVDANTHWLALVPWWAAWPFEILLIARDRVSRLPELTLPARAALAEIMGCLTARYDNLFGCSFPYSMGWHQSPLSSRDPKSWRLHAHFYPPLLRSATVRKFMVGFEMLGEAQRDLTPEQAAARLRDAAPFLVQG